MFPVRLFRGYKSGIVATVSASLIGFQLGRDETFVTRVYFAGQSSANLGLGGKKERKKERKKGRRRKCGFKFVTRGARNSGKSFSLAVANRWRIFNRFLSRFPFDGFPPIRRQMEARHFIIREKKNESRRGLKNAGNLEDR